MMPMWVDTVADQIVGALEELTGEDHYRGGAVTNLAILQVRELHQNLEIGGGGTGGVGGGRRKED